MRKWCAFVALGAFLTLPLCAQQKDASTENIPASAAADRSSTGNAGDSDFHVTPSSNLFAMPAMPAPRPNPADVYTDWANSPWQRHAWGRLTPRFEVAGMFQYVNFFPGPFSNFNNYGATGSFTYNANRWLGLTAEIGGYHFTRQIFGAPITNPDGSVTLPTQSITGSWQTYMVGPRLNLRKFDHFVPFAEVLFGAAHSGAQLNGTGDQTDFAMAAGGGVDVILTKYLAWRFFEADYLMTNFSGTLVGANAHQDNFRIGSGLVLRWGYPPEPPKPIHAPTAACSANPTSVYQGSTDIIAIHVDATDPDKVGLNYSYTATGGTVDGTGPDARFNPSGLAVGSYTVTAKVDNGHGGSTSCAVDVAVNQRPNRPPVISCAPERNPINAGERVGINATASDPDGDPLTYSYAANAGQVTGNGPAAQFDSTGLKAGSYTVTCTADDGRGGRTSADTRVDVQEQREIKELEVRLALHDIYFPTDRPTVSNPKGGLLPSQIKTLDALVRDFTRYLTFRPDAHLILVGHADIRGTKEYNLKLSDRRVERVKSYLVEHGVPADHLETHAAGEEQNSPAEVKAMIEQDTTVSEETRQKLLRNITAIALANNRRVDVTLSTTGQQGVRGLPFNAEDAAALIRREAEEPKKPANKPASKKPAQR